MFWLIVITARWTGGAKLLFRRQVLVLKGRGRFFLFFYHHQTKMILARIPHTIVLGATFWGFGLLLCRIVATVSFHVEPIVRAGLLSSSRDSTPSTCFVLHKPLHKCGVELCKSVKIFKF